MSNKNYTNNMIRVLMGFITCYLFFSYSKVTNIIIFIVPVLLLVCGLFVKNYKESIMVLKEDKLWILFLSCSLIISLLGNYKKEGIIFSLFLVSMVCLKIFISNSYLFYDYFIKLCLCFSSIHLLCTFMQVYYSEIIMMINKLILSQQSYNVNWSQLTRGKYAGITSQSGTNAFYITIFIAIIFCKIFSCHKKRKKIIYFLLILFAFYGLELTQKRGLFLINIVIIIVFLIVKFMKQFKQKKQIKLFITIAFIFISFLMIAIIYYNKELLIRYLVDEDVSSGRIDIYMHVFEMLKEKNFILANGIGAVEDIIGIKAHNVYLQVWAENGLLGVLLYITVLIKSLITSISIYKKMISVEEKFFIATSIYIQLVFIMYGMVGNPLYDYFMVGMYILMTAIPVTISFAIKKWK